MASNSTESPDGETGESKGNSKLDNLSREDLIKFVKKQMTLLQKSKSQCDGLNRELAKTKDALKKVSENKSSEKESGDHEERESLIQAYNASQSALEESAAKITSLTEQTNCLQQKNETLTALYQCMQNEFDTAVSRSKELENSIAVLSEARDEAVRQLASKKQSEIIADAKPVVCSNCGAMKSKVEALTGALSELRNQMESFQPVEEERNQLKLDLSHIQEKLAKAVVVIDKLKKERSLLREQLAEGQASQTALLDLQQAFDKVVQDKEASDNEKLVALKELEVANGEVDKSRRQLDELLSRIEILQRAKAEIEEQVKGTLLEKETCSEKAAHLQDELMLSQQNISNLETQLADAKSSSSHFAKAFDDISRKFTEVLQEKLEAGEELERFFSALSKIGTEINAENVVVTQFNDAEQFLMSVGEKYFAIVVELESEKKSNKELNQELTELKAGGQTTGNLETSESGENPGTCSGELQELLLQIDELKAEIETQVRSKEELRSDNEELKLTIKCLELRLDPQFVEKDVDRATSLTSDDGALTSDDGALTLNKKSDEILKVDREFSRESVESFAESENITEKDVLLQELMFLREKLADWETMMSMLQTEKNGLEKELTKAGERETRSNNLLEEILRSLNDTLKGRDLFHDETKTIEDNGLLYAKLCVLQTIIDETNFERDETREKIQHLNEQVAELEKRVLESASNNESSNRSSGSEKTEDNDLTASEEFTKEEQIPKTSGDVEDSLVDELNRKIEALNVEIQELKQLLETEKFEAKKWRCSFEEQRQITDDLQLARDSVEEELIRAKEELRAVHLKYETTKSDSESEQRQGTVVSTDKELVESSGSEKKSDGSDSGSDEKEKLIMTDRVQLKTFKQNERFVVEVLSEEEKMRLLEENENLKKEILLLKNRSSESVEGRAVTLTKETSTTLTEETLLGAVIETSREISSEVSVVDHADLGTQHGILEEKPMEVEATEKGNCYGKDSSGAVEMEQLLEECQQLRERLAAQYLELKEKNFEIENLKRQQNWGWEDTETTTSDKEEELERVREEFAKCRQELEAAIAAKNDKIEKLTEALSNITEENDQKIIDNESSRLQSELSRIQLEMEDLVKNKDAKIEDLESDLAKIREEKIAIETQMNSLNAEIVLLKENETDRSATHCAELENLKLEVVKLRETKDVEITEANQNVAAITAELADVKEKKDLSLKQKDIMIEELEQELTRLKQIESDMKLKDDELVNLRNDLSRAKEDYEELISSKDNQIKELSEKLVISQECEDLARKKEVEDVEGKILRLKEEADNLVREKNSEIERLKEKLSQLTEISQTAIQGRDLEIDSLRKESLETKATYSNLIETTEQQAKDLKELVDRINVEHDINIQDKNSEITRLTTELHRNSEEAASLVASRDSEIQALLDEIAALKTDVHQIDDKSEEIVHLKSDLMAANDQIGKLLKEHELKIVEFSGDLEKSKQELAVVISSKDAELNEVQLELDHERTEQTRMLKEKDAKIHELEIALEKLTDDVNKFSESNLKLISVEKEYDSLRSTMSDKEKEREELTDELAALRKQLDASFERKEEEQTEIQTVQLQESQVQRSSAEADEALAAAQLQLKDREERENKLKQLTLKAKKEAAELKTKLISCQKELDISRAKLAEANSNNACNQSVQFQSLQTEYENLESLFEAEKSSRQELEKNFRKAVEELTNSKVAAAELAEEKSKLVWEIQKVEQEKKECETQRSEKEMEIHAERIQREQMTREKSEMETRLFKAETRLKEIEDESKTEIKLLQEQIKTSKQELSLAKTEIQQSNMMDLEIADYERAVKSLNEIVADRDAKIKSLNDEIDRQQEQKTTMQKLLDSSSSQYTQLDDHCNKLKQLLVKSKKDLVEAKKLESEQRTSDAHLRGQLERLTQLTEEQKLQIASLVAENQKQSDKLRLHSDSHQRTAQSLEQRVLSLEQELLLARSELASVQTEYDGYKVRVHSVLKHQKTKSGSGEDLSLEQERAERQQLEKFVDSLKTKLVDVSHQMSSISSENERLQEEYDRLQARQTKLIVEMEASERNWRDRLEKMNAESSLNSRQKVEVIQQLTLQSESISTNFKEQIQSIQEEHQRVVQSLRQQLDAAEIELDRCRARLQNQNSNPIPSGNSGVTLHLVDREASPDRVLEFVKELRPEERQSGEGSENIEDTHVRTTSAVNHSLLPFEQLLDSSQMDDTISVKTVESTAEEMALKVSLVSAEKRIEHLTQILNESEATVLRLTEQASILKGEIRRMERNQERENAISNMEYLKNIVFKFLTLKSGDERLQLIPVLTTMLKLSPDEKDSMTVIATGNEGAPASGQEASGWGTYLHRWSGLV